MDRRSFLRTGAASIAAAGLTSLELKALNTGVPAFDTIPSSESPGPSDEGKLYLKFLGTGASGKRSDRESRQKLGARQSSVLLDGRIMIDLTADVLDLLTKNFKPLCVFYTHSHGDHYNPKVAVRMGVPKVYVHESWYERAISEFSKASEETGFQTPDIIPLKIGRSIKLGTVTMTPLPANHVTSDYDEQALIYLIEKGTTRLLYATDTSGIMGRAARIAGIDAHLPEEDRKPITALIMEATMPDDDFRIFNHSTFKEVRRTVSMLEETQLYKPAPGQPVWITHRGMSLYGNRTPDELDAMWPSDFKSARDGMDIFL